MSHSGCIGRTDDDEEVYESPNGGTYTKIQDDNFNLGGFAGLTETATPEEITEAIENGGCS